MGIAAHAILTDENGKRTGDVQYSIACVDRMGYAAGAILTYLDEPPEVWEERARNFDWKEFQELARHYPIC